MSDRKRQKARRSVLQTGAAALAGLSVPSVAIAGGSSTQKEGINTNFDPDNKDEVSYFMDNFLSFSREKQGNIYKELSNKQQDIVAEKLELKKIKVTSTQSTSSENNFTTSSNAYTEQFTITGQAFGGRDIWDYHHEIRYEYSGSGCPIDITKVTNSAWSTDRAFGWSYDGEVENTTKVVDGGCGGSDEARSRVQGKFTYSLNGTFYTANPLSRLAGSTKYDFGISKYVEDAWLLEQKCDFCDGIAGN